LLIIEKNLFFTIILTALHSCSSIACVSTSPDLWVLDSATIF